MSPPVAVSTTPWRELALLACLATLWGASYSFIKIGVETIPPITLIAARTLIAGGVLLAVLAARGIALPRDRDTWRKFLFQAVLNSVLPFTLIAWAELRVEAGVAAILNSTTPIFAFLITAVLTRHERVTARKLFGCLAGLGGSCLIIGLPATGGDWLPQMAIIVATVCYAAAAIFGKTFRGHDPMVPAAGSLLAGTLLLISVSLVADRPWTLAPSAASLAALLALSVFSTALALVIYFRLLHTLGTIGTTSQAYLRVPVGVAIGVVFLGDVLAPEAWAGLILVVAGVVCMTLPDRGSAPA